MSRTPHGPRTPLSHYAFHSGLDPESIFILSTKYWMPDQVWHDTKGTLKPWARWPISATPHGPRALRSHRACHFGLDPESIYCRIGRLSEGMLRPTLVANLLRVTTPSPGQGAPAASSISSAGHGRPAICRAEQDVRRHEPACRFCLWGHGGIPVRPGVLGARPRSAPKPGPGNLSRSNEATGVGWNNPSGNVSLRLGPSVAATHGPRAPRSHRACHSGLDPESMSYREIV